MLHPKTAHLRKPAQVFLRDHSIHKLLWAGHLGGIFLAKINNEEQVLPEIVRSPFEIYVLVEAAWKRAVIQ